MADRSDAQCPKSIHPVHAALLAGAAPLFLGGLLSDLAYGATAQIQWSNFAAWLIAGAMVFTGVSLLWASIALIRGRPRSGWRFLCFVLLLATFVLGLINSFVHARDAWGIMPTAPILSAIVIVIILLATSVGLSSLRAGERR